MGRRDANDIVLSPLQSGIPDHVSRFKKYGAIQPQSSDTKHVARWVWAVVVGVGAAVAGWWL
jgi:hypothetical protein